MIKKLLKKVHQEYKDIWKKETALSLIGGLVLLVVALLIERSADQYVSNLQGIAVADLILNHLPTVDIDVVIVQGVLLFTFAVFFLLLTKPKFIPFTIKALAVFVVVRSFFISLTHLGVSPAELTFDTHSIGFGLYNLLYNTRGDFFFSGHTGIPFLMALIFWQNKFWRYCFFAISFIFGASVLLAHIHYSIDVFAAPFITYAIYIISKRFFHKDYKLTIR